MTWLYPALLWILIPLIVYGIKRWRIYSLGDWLRWVALWLLVIALARPVMVLSPQQEEVSSHALILGLDLSASMRAKDIAPSRLEAARATIRAFLSLNRYDQVALIGFTTNALLLSPPTMDHALVGMALDTINPNYILTKGTDLKKLLMRVERLGSGKRWLILFTDGGDAPIDQELVERVKEASIEILVLAMATPQGATIEDGDGNLLKDSSGNIVVSKRNQELKQLGEVLPFVNPKESAKMIETWVQSIHEKESTLRRSQSHKELFMFPAVVALVLIFLSGTHFIRYLTLLLVFWGQPLDAGGVLEGYHLHQAYLLYEAQEYNASLRHLHAIETPTLFSERLRAHIYYRLSQFKRAKAILASLKTPNPVIKQQLLYELGNCEAKLAYFKKAKHLYVQALQLGEDEDALHNLAWVMRQLQKNTSKVGLHNPQGGATPTSSMDNLIQEEATQEKLSNTTIKSAGSGGGGKQLSKSMVESLPSPPKEKTQRVMSSNAYDLINQGYIEEREPW